MTLTAGTLIEHTTWGRGKVVAVTPPYFTAHFTSLESSAQGPQRRLQLNTGFVSIAAVQSDPLLDHVGSTAARRGPRKRAQPKAKPQPTVHSLEEAVEWFVRQYPGRFDDPKLVGTELGYKREAQALFRHQFGNGKGRALLEANDLATIAEGLAKLYASTNIPSRFEMMAARDGLKDLAAASVLLRALLNFVSHQDANTFERLASAVAGLPAPADGTPVLTWPNVTILPFLADPAHCIVLKPLITRRMARRVGVDLMYSMPPTWHTYSLLMEMANRLLERLAPLGAKDFIDVQSFIWVTQDLDKTDVSPAAAMATGITALQSQPLDERPDHRLSEVEAEVIVAVGAEGGSLTIEGRRLADGSWLFRMDKRETWLLDDEDPPVGFQPNTKTDWTSSLEEALSRFDRYPWPRLYPLEVHANFVDTVLAIVERHPKGGLDEGRRWSERVKGFSSAVRPTGESRP